MYDLYNSIGEKYPANKDFMNLFKTKWNDMYDNSNIFRYKLNNLQERIINEKFFIQLNFDRAYKRRKPQHIDNICQPFDESQFNFTKVSSEEIMFSISDKSEKDCNHAILVNVSPISKYHALLCPSIDKCLPQLVTKDSLQLAIDIMFLASDRDLRIGFNSLCALASVNHLHYHMCLVKQDLPVEFIKCKQLKGPLYCFDEVYPASAFCFELHSPSNASDDIHKLLDHLIEHSIAHNVLITRGMSFNSEKQVCRAIVYPRRSSFGVKQYDAFNVAVFELSGWLIVSDNFETLQEDDIERELNKWKYADFDELCDRVKLLY